MSFHPKYLNIFHFYVGMLGMITWYLYEALQMPNVIS